MPIGIQCAMRVERAFAIFAQNWCDKLETSTVRVQPRTQITGKNQSAPPGMAFAFAKRIQASIMRAQLSPT